MLRKEFEDHGLWAQIDSALVTLEGIRETAKADETPSLQRIGFLLRHTHSFRALAPAYSEMFNEGLLAPATSAVSQVLSNLNQRAAGMPYRSYTENALAQAEALLVHIGPWPRPYARGGQIKQMATLFQDLLAAQATQIASLESKYEQAKSDIDALVSNVNSRASDVENVLETFRNEGDGVLKAVNEQKARIDDVIQKGLEKVSDLQGQNSEAFDSWKSHRQEDWDSFSQAHETAMESAAGKAEASLQKLKDDEKEYANISSHLGGAKLAGEFDREAKSAQKLGLLLYAIGFAILAAAAAPLVILMIWPPIYQASEGPWQHFLIRVSLGVLGASAATVLIRLGSRFLTGATASRRMALELQTFGPFLANVKDKDTVDGARLELVDRAFGKSYVPSNTDSNEEAVPVSAFAHILELVKAMK